MDRGRARGGAAASYVARRGIRRLESPNSTPWPSSSTRAIAAPPARRPVISATSPARGRREQHGGGRGDGKQRGEVQLGGDDDGGPRTGGPGPPRTRPPSCLNARAPERLVESGMGLPQNRLMSLRLVVMRSGLAVEQGTAWPASPRHVFTAFHVVGHCDTRRWAHELDPERTYQLHDGRTLRPLGFCTTGDVALLEIQGAGAPAWLAIATGAVAADARWTAHGFPGFANGRAFTLRGTIAAVDPQESSRSLQLTVDQGTEVAWNGISGSPVTVDDRVIALITNVTPATATAWAAPASTLLRVAREANVVLPSPVAPAAIDLGALDHVDLRTLARALFDVLAGVPQRLTFDISLGSGRHELRIRHELAANSKLRDDAREDVRHHLVMIETFADNIRFYTEQLETLLGQAHPHTRRELRENQRKLADEEYMLKATLARMLA